ncbi:hypothetical protein SERLADRAFT_432780 [Serpula lacrymans var. lacrymans S7.9]|uniref:Methyltransferase domain-containing protein n=1 Tax=Serpula lacrymans var. lacrymans (strain S7.9) TaxID=578457 RepID=F8NEX4_SERL9|nr:uncharacterized protein SERLADRAFT_432780 [Serpula lacrymans var. lacrymans S7.9]EGO31122.1 hypothetical protein SERLADRAFT_432780 [Serpula lacrymans var. lacrymans S7.9]
MSAHFSNPLFPPHDDADDLDDFASDIGSDVYTDISMDPFSPSIASSRTSADISIRSASPAPSVYSLTSSLRAQSFRHEYGRGLNNYSEVYRLPADDEELERLDKQYDMFYRVMGKYPNPLPQILADDVPGETKAVLDLGCGSGKWIMDVACEFPHSTAVAVDLVPMQSLSMPPNCRSEVDDINLGLEHFYGDFNVVHAQLISSGIKDYKGLIDHISHVLRPGGLIDLTEFPFTFHSYDKKMMLPSPDDLQAPWAPLWMSLANGAVRKQGGSADASFNLHRWISEHPAFEDVTYREWWIPCSPWLQGKDAESVFWNEIGATMRDDILVGGRRRSFSPPLSFLLQAAFMSSGRPLLLGSGYSEALVDDIEAKARAELLEARTPSYVHVQNVYARKKHH